ncbi:DUF637 domain-containing protein [Microbulbifer sp. VAAF005]|uniref:DUF637 domain-containing protein n=1 Tax=Microbulbifer sp. VAAF005 TaxID=3034230 RepID=UPI0024AC9439|nr:DUF637 domain-containing protein [Microbulbifer sp. VAAF005]WHI48004.1 DUF637 domain-containing protein [Microbulbifer sp. VAAF005]
MNLTGGVKGLKNKMNQENTTVTSCKKRIGMRFFTHLVAFCFLFQTMLPAYAAALSSGQIQQVLDSIAEIEFSTTSGSYQYTAVPYIDTSVQDGYSNIQDFYGRLRDEYIESLGSPTYVPIGVGGITTILPIYDNPKLVGDSFVQSRYVRDQIQELLGRHLIDSDSAYFKDETSQLKTLYDNAFLYAKLASTTEIYGDPISESKFDRENSPYDMVWPERRVIHGETVIVPVVYLTEQTIAERRVTDHSVGFNSNVSFSRINIQDVDIKLGREAFLNVAGDFVAQNSSVSGCELDIVVGGSLRLLSSQVDACGNLTIDAGSLEARTLVHRYDFGNETGGFFGEVTTISADGHLVVRSGSDIVLQGVTVSAGDELTFAANGNIYIGTENITSSFEGKQGGWYVQKSGVSYLQSKLTAGETIQLIAGGQIVLDATEIVSDRGHIELLAGLGITIEDELETSQTYKKGKFGKKAIEESIYQTVAIRSLLDAGKGIRLHSEFGDITLRAADITSEEGTAIKAATGGVNLLMTTETDQYSYSSIEKGLFTVSTKNKGHVIETGVTNSIVGGLAVEAFSTVNVEYEGDRSLSMEEQIAQLSKMEGLEWMTYVRSDFPNADWTAIELQYDKWNESSTSISPAFAAVISIAMAIVTSGASAGWLEAAIAAGVATLKTQLVLALANGIVDGDIAGSMENLASSDTLKSLAVAMVTAGALHQIDATFFGADTNAINEGKEAYDTAIALNPNDIAAADTAFQTAFDAAAAKSVLSPLQQATQAVTHAAVRAGIETGVYDTDFEDSFTQSLMQNGINRLGAYMAQKIGNAWDPKDSNSEVSNWDTAMKYLAHAGSGCVVGVLTAENSGQQNASEGCVTGGAGAVIGEFTATVYRERTKAQVDEAEAAISDLLNIYSEDAKEYADRGYSLAQIDEIFRHEYGIGRIEEQITTLKQRGVDLAGFSAGLTAFMAGAEAAGVHTAADVGAITAENNALFLLLIPVLLKAIDVVLLGVDLYPIYQAYRDGGVDAGNQALADYIIENGATSLVLAFFPGGKIGDKFISKMDGNELVEAIKTWGSKIEDYAESTGEAFLNFIDSKVEMAFDGLRDYIYKREMRDDVPELSHNSNQVDTEAYIKGIAGERFTRQGDIYIGPLKGRYRDTGVLYNGMPILQADGQSRYIYVDKNGVIHDVNSPFSSNVNTWRIHHDAEVARFESEFVNTHGLEVRLEQTLQNDNPDNPEFYGMKARADVTITGGDGGEELDIPADYILTDLSGNIIPNNKIKLDEDGRAIIEVKTGNADLSDNQKVVYSACAAGDASSCYDKKSDFEGAFGETNVYILRSTRAP